MEIPARVQFENLSLPLINRHEYRKENQHKEDGPHQHHGPDEPKVVKGFRFQEKQPQEGTYGGDIARKERIHLLRQGLPAVRLVLQMIDVMQRIINRYAYDRASNSQYDDAHAGLEAGYDAQGKHSAHQDGKKDPQHILHAFVTHPKHNADEDEGYGQGQERVCLDAGRILHCHLRPACRSNPNSRKSLRRFFLDGFQSRQQFSVLGTLRAAIRRIKEEDIRILKGLRLSLLEAIQNGRIKAQRVAPQVFGREGIAQDQGFLVLLEFGRDISRSSQQGIHPGIIFFLQEIGPVGAQKIKYIGCLRGSFIHVDIRESLFPAVLESIKGLLAFFRRASLEEDRHLLIPSGLLQLFPGILRQKGRYILLEMQP